MSIIGAVAKVLAFRSYVEEKEDLKLSVKVPGVEMISQDTNGLAGSINHMRLCQVLQVQLNSKLKALLQRLRRARRR